MKARISYSVGKKGRNDRDDVRVIQRKLNEFIFPPTTKLRVDGYAGTKTIGAILEFQKTYTNLRSIDGRVDPHGATIGRLNGRITFHPVQIRATSGTNAQENVFGSKETEQLIEQEVKTQGGTESNYEEFIAFYKNIKPQINKYRKGIGTVNNIRKLVAFYFFWKRLININAYNISQMKEFPSMFSAFMSSDKDLVGLIKIADKPLNRFSKLLKSTSNVASKVGLVILAIDIVHALKTGDFGIATGKIYKYVMGKRVPWASMIGALQEFVELVLPGSTKNNKFFKILRTLDPIGLGAKGVDSVITSLCCLVQYVLGDATGSEAKLQKLGARLRKGPTAFFTDIADWEWVVRHYFPDVYEQDKQTILQLRRRYDRIPAVSTGIPIHQKL